MGWWLLTVALAGPTRDVRIPRNRAVIMLVVDVSQSMRATDVDPTRLAAAQQAAKQFASGLTPGINLGLVAFAGNADLLVAPNPDHQATIDALDKLQTADRTATGEAIFTALQSIATVGAVLSSDGDTSPAARAHRAALRWRRERARRPQQPARGLHRGAIRQGPGGADLDHSFGTPGGYVDLNNQRLPVPVGRETMTQIAQLSGGQTYTATNVEQLNQSYESVQQQIGFQVLPGPASEGWVRMAVLVATIAAVLALAINRRLPT